MIDLKMLKRAPAELEAALAKRGIPSSQVQELLRANEAYLASMKVCENLQADINERAKFLASRAMEVRADVEKWRGVYQALEIAILSGDKSTEVECVKILDEEAARHVAKGEGKKFLEESIVRCKGSDQEKKDLEESIVRCKGSDQEKKDLEESLARHVAEMEEFKKIVEGPRAPPEGASPEEVEEFVQKLQGQGLPSVDESYKSTKEALDEYTEPKLVEKLAQEPDTKSQLAEFRMDLDAAKERLDELAFNVPNLPWPDVTTQDEWLDPLELLGPEYQSKTLKNSNLNHVDIMERLGGWCPDSASSLATTRFVVMKGVLAKLERALGQFMLDVNTKEHGYVEYSVPFLSNTQTMRGTGQLPKFAQDLYKVPEDDLWLIPTAEVALVNLLRGKDYSAHMCALTPCFRREAGAAGRRDRGLLRVHQFCKVELVSIVNEKESQDRLVEMCRHVCNVLNKLEIPYRLRRLAAGDMGFSAAKTIDVEAWFPGEDKGKGRWIEVSSVSNCTDFQVRRMLKSSKKGLHTLNASGLSVGRVMAAVLTNHVDENGVTLPECLHPYMVGKLEW